MHSQYLIIHEFNIICPFANAKFLLLGRKIQSKARKILILIIDLIPFKHGFNFWVHQFVTMSNEIEKKTSSTLAGHGV